MLMFTIILCGDSMSGEKYYEYVYFKHDPNTGCNLRVLYTGAEINEYSAKTGDFIVSIECDEDFYEVTLTVEEIAYLAILLLKYVNRAHDDLYNLLSLASMYFAQDVESDSDEDKAYW